MKSFFEVGRGTGSTADYRLDVAYDDYRMKRTGRYIMTCAVEDEEA
jgi:hypothetical protein